LFSFNVPAIGVFKANILFFDPQKSLIVSGTLQELVNFTAFYGIAPDAYRYLQPFAWQRSF
jgi:hypothetical protein